MDKRRKAELRAGLFLNFGLLLIMVALFLFRSNLDVVSHSVNYRVILPSADGLLVGTKVLIAGLDAGRINHLTLDVQTRKIQADLKIDQKYRNAIRQDSVAELVSEGVLGDKVVMISPGSPDSPLVPAGGALPSKPASDLGRLINQGDALLRDADLLVQDISRIIAGFGSSHEGMRISSSLIRTLDNLSELSGKLNRQLNIQKADEALTKLDNILGKLDSGTGTLGALINDPSLYDDAKALVGETNKNRIVRNLVRKSVQEARESTAPPSG